MTTTSLLRSWLFVVGGLATCAFAQIGDSLDKPGEIQKSLVPAHLIPSSPALRPEEAMKTFRVAPGYRLELAAADPLVQDPVAIAFGVDGRMWVVEMRGYMADVEGNGEDLAVGRIVVLTDRDGDGRFDTSTVFLDRLVLPRAILPVADGVLVGAPPELVFWRDTDGDGQADKKIVVAADYGVRVDPQRPHLANPERAPNSLLWAYDNWIYSAAYTKKFRYVNGEWETRATDFRGQWGLGQDDAGHFFHGFNSDYLRVDVIFGDYLRRNPNYPRLAGTNVNAAVDQFVWPARVNPGINRGYRPEMLRDGRLKEFTAACGFFVYRGDLLPELTGNSIVAEPSANLVRRAVLTAENGTLVGRNAYDRGEFLTSTDERFRPVNFATGPDGALYIVDLYRGVIEHRISLTTYLREQIEERGLQDPQHLGRIYRVVPADRPAPRAASYGPFTAAQWVERLSHPNAFWREAAQRTLVTHRDPADVAAIRAVATAGATPLGRVHALWTLDGVGALDRATVLAALGAEAAAVRAAAIRLSEKFLAGPDRATFGPRLLALAKNSEPAVQLQAVLSLGEARDDAIDRELAETVRLHPRNTFLADAFFSGLVDRELPLLEQLAADPSWAPDDPAANKVLAGLAQGVFASRQIANIEKLFTLAADQSARLARAEALLDGVVAAAGPARRALTFDRPPTGWIQLAENPAFKTRLAKLERVVVWPGKPGVAALVAPPLKPGEEKRFANGQVLFTAICATCHQTTGRGLDGLAPPLLDSEWVLGPPERITRIVLSGLRGNVVVLGRTHHGDMPAFGALDDESIAAILTYIRREWGHTASPVEPAFVKSVRAATAGRIDAWSPEELQLEVKP
ncbi:MAG: c-type cytochrome [Opitutus sp.]|nr:c-type cytochrome [Opitutus sp.]